MKRVTRLTLPIDVSTYLQRRQQLIDNGGDVENVWSTSRRTQKIKKLLSVLKKMSGRGAYCMYCRCSEGNEIDHYKPKSRFKDLAFDWDNLLLICGGCNRNKLDKFEEIYGETQLLNPTIHTPWEHFEVLPEVGHLVGLTSIGTYTTNLLKLSERDTIIDKVKDEVENIFECLSEYLDAKISKQKLIKELYKFNQVNLLEWLFFHNGKYLPIMVLFAESHTTVFEEIKSTLITP